MCSLAGVFLIRNFVLEVKGVVAALARVVVVALYVDMVYVRAFFVGGDFVIIIVAYLLFPN